MAHHESLTMDRLLDNEDPSRLRTMCNGYLLLLASLTVWLVLTYAVVVSPFMPDTDHALLDALKRDSFYKLLLPICVPVTVIVLYVSWLGMKLFRSSPK